MVWYLWKQRNAYVSGKLNEILENNKKNLLSRFEEVLHGLGLEEVELMSIVGRSNKVTIH